MLPPVPLTAVSPKSGVAFPIGMTTSLRGALRTAPARDGKGRDVLYARIFDAREPGERVTWLRRYAFEGGRWVEHTRMVPGWRELGGLESLPPAGEFP
jgi:hypothetical protein